MGCLAGLIRGARALPWVTNMRLSRQLALLMALLGSSGLALADTLQKIASSGRVTLGYRESSVPFSYLAGPRQPIGFGVDIYTHLIPALKRATGRSDLEINWQALTSQNRIPLIANGTVDLECGSTSNTAARAKTVAFAINYFYTGPKLLVKQTSGVKDFEDLAGKTVAVTTGTTTMKLLRKMDLERSMNMQLLPGKDHVDSFLLVDAGRAVAFAMDDILLYGQILNAKQPAQWQVVGTPPQVEPYACMLRKDDAVFKRVVDGVITDLMRSGEFERLYAKWFLSPIPPRGRSLNLPMSEALRNNLRTLSDQPAS